MRRARGLYLSHEGILGRSLRFLTSGEANMETHKAARLNEALNQFRFRVNIECRFSGFPM